MSTTKKILLGLLALWPFIYFFLFILVLFLYDGFIFLPAGDIETMFAYMLTSQLLTMALVVTTFILYIRDVFINPRVRETRKTLWVILLLFGNFIAMPIYWYLYIWKQPVKVLKKQRSR